MEIIKNIRHKYARNFLNQDGGNYGVLEQRFSWNTG